MPEYNLSNPIKPILRIRSITMACMLVLLSACDPHKQGDSQQNKIKVNYEPYTFMPLSARAEMGKKLFFEPTLSASGKMSCASCHNPTHAFGPSNALAVQLGGKDLHLQGIRAAPNLTYAKEAPQFAIGPSDDDQPRAITANNKQLPTQDPKLLTPHGGLFWDGRASSLKQQAIGPLMNPLEMANASKKELIHSIKKLYYFNDLKKLIDPQKFTNDDLFLSEVMFLIARYQSEDRAFAAYNSKYDLYLQQKVQLTDAEKHGLALFDDPKKGNCAACHLDQPRADGKPPLLLIMSMSLLAFHVTSRSKQTTIQHFSILGSAVQVERIYT